MRVEVTGNHGHMEFDSIDDIRRQVAHNHRDAPVLRHLGEEKDYFGGLRSFDELMDLGRNGWEDDLDRVVSVSEDTIKTIEDTFEVQAWQSVYDVTGSDVDVDRYLSGQPENMISYVMMDTPKVGRVVSLSVNVGASGIISAETIITRGKNIVALVHALESLGLRTELYADLQAKSSSWDGNSNTTIRTIVRVKAADEMLDPAMVMFAFAHPAFMRGFMLSTMHAYPEKIAKGVGAGQGYGIPTKGFGTEVLPENTMQIDSSMTGAWTKSMAQDFVVEHLKELGIIS